MINAGDDGNEKKLRLVFTVAFVCFLILGSAIAEERILFGKMGDVRFFQADGKIGLMDAQENVLYPAELDMAGAFQDHGLCLVRKDNQVAMMNKAGGIIREIYVKEKAASAQEALYKENVLEAFYDENGRQIDKPWKRIATYDGKQMAQGEVWGFVDARWNMVSETDFAELRFFEDKYLAPPSLAVGMACLKGEAKWRLIDAEFNVLSSNEWERLAYIGQDRFLGQNTKKKKWESAILNEKGEVLFTFPLGYFVRAFVDEGYILYETNIENKKGHWGFYDYEGNQTCKIKKSKYPLMPGEIPDVYPKLQDGVMVVFDKGKQNVIVHAATGRVYASVNMNWDHINDFSFGRAFARSGTHWYLVNDIGSMITGERLTDVRPFEERDGFVSAGATYTENKRIVIIDTQGRVVAGYPDPDIK